MNIFKLKQKTLIILSGVLWSAIGALLMWKGIGYFKEILLNFQSQSYPLISRIVHVTGGVENGIIMLIFVALIVGFAKGRFVLSKSANRGIERIKALPNPVVFYRMYSAPYWLLYLFMMSLGMMMKLFGVPIDIRAVVDLAVGSALVKGSMIYYRRAVA